MPLQTQCPTNDEHVSADEARRNMSCRPRTLASSSLAHQPVSFFCSYQKSFVECPTAIFTTAAMVLLKVNLG